MNAVPGIEFPRKPAFRALTRNPATGIFKERAMPPTRAGDIDLLTDDFVDAGCGDDGLDGDGDDVAPSANALPTISYVIGRARKARKRTRYFACRQRV